MVRQLPEWIRAAVRRVLAGADAVANRLYGWRGNPLHQSGTVAVLALAVMLVSGLYLLLFYRIGAPYESMQRIEAQVFTGRWIRALHRYAADLAIVAALVHALRMFAQQRCWGPRTLAWISGLGLLGLLFVCGWTGYVMVWDEHGRLLAVLGARLLDALPLFSEPIARTFVGERPMPGAFFFLNLFAHIALPIGVALGLWLHLSRLARPVLLPPRALAGALLLGLIAMAILIPPGLGPRADAFRLPDSVEIDALYGFWLPIVQRLEPGQAWAALALLLGVAVLVPWWSRPPRESQPEKSRSDELHCTGCLQCALDCPYSAIDMVPGPRGHEVARVDPAMCVSCGICAGSCAPMVVGPPARSGRDQLALARAFVRERMSPGDVVVVACANGAGRGAMGGGPQGAGVFDGSPLYAASCLGNLHTSVIEVLLHSGAAGVLLAPCPPRDCWNREGPKWLFERIAHGREAELQDRVDRRRLALVHAGECEAGRAREALAQLRAEVARLEPPVARPALDLDAECDGPAASGDAARAAR